MDLYGDGEFLCKTPFTLQVVPQSLRVLVPQETEAAGRRSAGTQGIRPKSQMGVVTNR